MSQNNTEASFVVPEFPDAPLSNNFQEFCSEMTHYAQNQIEFHRAEYFAVSQKLFQKLMNCYKVIRQTNDESEACAKPYMNIMDDIHVNLILQTQNLNSDLEKCTDF